MDPSPSKSMLDTMTRIANGASKYPSNSPWPKLLEISSAGGPQAIMMLLLAIPSVRSARFENIDDTYDPCCLAAVGRPTGLSKSHARRVHMQTDSRPSTELVDDLAATLSHHDRLSRFSRLREPEMLCSYTSSRHSRT